MEIEIIIYKPISKRNISENYSSLLWTFWTPIVGRKILIQKDRLFSSYSWWFKHFFEMANHTTFIIVEGAISWAEFLTSKSIFAQTILKQAVMNQESSLINQCESLILHIPKHI